MVSRRFVNFEHFTNKSQISTKVLETITTATFLACTRESGFRHVAAANICFAKIVLPNSDFASTSYNIHAKLI